MSSSATPAIRSASSPERLAPVWTAGSRPARWLSPGAAWPKPSRYTGGWRRSRARSADVTITATAPFETRQQSSRCSGSTIQRDAW